MKKKLIPSIIALSLILTIAIPLQAVHADEQTPEDGVTTIVAKEVRHAHWANLFDDLGRNGYVVLAPALSNDTTLHSMVAKTLYSLEIVLPQFGTRTRLPKYKKLIYTKAVIDVQGDVTVTLHDEMPFQPDQKSGPGLTYLTVEATTAVDQRTPPREVRDYTITLHLTGLSGILQDGTKEDLGDYSIVFNPQFIFYHVNDLSQMPSVQLSPGMGGMMQAPPRSGADNVEGPTPVLACEKIDDVEFCEPQDNNCQEGIDESFPGRGDSCDENDADPGESPLIIIPPGENSFHVQPLD